VISGEIFGDFFQGSVGVYRSIDPAIVINHQPNTFITAPPAVVRQARPVAQRTRRWAYSVRKTEICGATGNGQVIKETRLKRN
jgi:hypothetical protein